jgi:DNA mismatch repair protein MSH4
VALEARGARELACTTHELNALNARLKDAANDCMLLTEQVWRNCMLALELQLGLRFGGDT